ncbi:transcriptional regulator [Sporanaerobium hydrogeniformans]|uniref:Transcriptional regulator n=1 Tax=Sporanaerobium hydrogeniformans TaxID=3072179 RepID=A0AC61DGY7_9FIRM|nr:GntR family transcriptional regulator [Sporanaerobium hydrogeniformans]PHV71966.1 transcriptional regulator [Sporanaerobium hydrogeniformans]
MNETNTPLQPVQKKSLYLHISDSIYSYIKLNNLQPGDKLPSEREMATMLQISRNSLREGLRILENRGLIYVKTGRGVFVSSPYGKSRALSIQLDTCSLEDITELQNTLDRQSVLNAIQRGSMEEKNELVQIAQELSILAQENTYSHVLDNSFHCKLYEMGKNAAIYQLIIKIREDRFIRRKDNSNESSKVWLYTIPTHLLLAQAILENNIEAALAAMDSINSYVGSQINTSTQ